jgi:protein required for attachment to host cells
MHRTCIALIDAARARVLTMDRVADATGVHDALVEHEDLVNPARRAASGALFSDHEGRGQSGTLSFGFDDHRRDHLEQLDAAFARDIVARIATHTRDHRVKQLVVCASPHMLGEVRRYLASVRREGLVVHELDTNLVQLPIAEVQARLIARHVLPA